MTASKRQFGLLPEGTQEIRSALHGSEAPACEIADLGNAGGAEVRDFAVLEVIPDLLDRVELGRVGRQELDLHVALLRFEPIADQATLMGIEPVPDDQRSAPAKLRAQPLEEFDELRSADRAREEPEVKAPEGESGDRRDLFPVEAVLKHRGLALGRPRACHGRALRQARLIYEDDGLSSGCGVFLAPAGAAASSARSPRRRA